MPGVIATIPKFMFSANGVPMVGGTLEVYVAGTTTPTNTWQDSALTIANTNPITLDARGECVLWLDSAVVYKFVLKNAPANGGVVQWTQDNISNPAALTNTLRADLAASSGASLVGFLQAGAGAVARTAQSKLRDMVNVLDFGAIGDGVTDASAAFIAAAATGKPLWMPQGDYLISQPVTFTSGLFGAGEGDVNAAGKTKITLTDTGQLIVGDWYCNWGGFEVRSAVNNKVFISNSGKSYWTFTNFVINKIGTATGQVGIEFSTTAASIYFNRLDNFVMRCDYPVVIKGTTNVFNANKLGMGVGGNKWYNFLSAITVEAGVQAVDANEFGGYFETGTNVLTFNGTALRQNRFRIINDLVTRVWNSGITVADANLWEILDGGFTFAGTYPQNQVLIGPLSSKVRGTNATANSIANATSTVLNYDAEAFDTLSEFTPGSGVFTPKNAGYYQISTGALSASVAWAVGNRWEVSIFKNGVKYAQGDYNVADAATTRQRSSCASALVYCNGTTDYIDSRVIHNQGAAVLIDTAPTANYFNAARV